MKRKSPSRFSLLWLFLALVAGAILEAPRLLRGHWEWMPYYTVFAVIWVAVVIAWFIGRSIRNRRLWIEDRQARGLKTYEQPRDAISNIPIVRRILFLPSESRNKSNSS
jgi:hypothetical protein